MSDARRTRTVHDLVAFLAERNTAQLFAAAERTGYLPRPLRDELGRLGLFGLSVPEHYGGLCFKLAERVRVHRLLGRVSASLQSILTVHEMAIHAITRFAGPAVAKRWLPTMAGGRCLGAFALTEPGGGSSLEQLRTTAKPCANGFVLHGKKAWASSALEARLCVTIARLGNEIKPFLVDCDGPGVTVAPSSPLGAFRAAAIGDLEFADCSVGNDHGLGSGGLSGLRIVTSCLAIGRILVAAGALGVGTAALDLVIEHSNRRMLGRRTLATQPLAQKAVAEAYVHLHAGLALLEAVVPAVESGEPSGGRHAMAAKLFAAEAARNATASAIRLHGAAGLVESSLLQRYRLETEVYSTIEGSTEVLSLGLGADVMSSGSDLGVQGGTAG